MYLEGIDAVAEGFNEHIESLEFIGDQLQHNLRMTELLKGENAYEDFGKIYENQINIIMYTINKGYIFNDYIVRDGQVQPLFASYCDGRNTICRGLSQWGSVSLANEGKNHLDILKHYYGNNINIVYTIVTLNPFPIPFFISFFKSLNL